VGADALIGARIGDYVIEERIAAGGMGVVYRAVHPLLKRAVAVKVVRPESATDEVLSQRFLREAQALAAIRHPGIVGIENFGKLPDGREYMVMEYLDGETLEARFVRQKKLSLEQLLPLLDETLEALAAAHAVGVVHRDLKPSNIFLLAGSSKQKVKLLDFGLAKQHRGLGAVNTQASMVGGTPQYVSPEQANGQTATARSDLYSFGVMVFELLTGKLPFAGQGWAELVAGHLTRPAPRLKEAWPGAPRAMDLLVARLLEKNPEGRPASAEEVRIELQIVRRELQTRRTQTDHPLQGPTDPLLSSDRVEAAMGARNARTTRVLPVAGRPLAGFVLGLGALGAVGAIAAWALAAPRAPTAPTAPTVPPVPPPVAAAELPPVPGKSLEPPSSAQQPAVANVVREPPDEPEPSAPVAKKSASPRAIDQAVLRQMTNELKTGKFANEFEKEKSPGLPRTNGVRSQCLRADWKPGAREFLQKVQRSRMTDAADVEALRLIDRQGVEFRKELDRSKTAEDCELFFIEVSSWALGGP
jgi:eukaryotic-like serine/threonine-protein kinase